MSHIVYRPLPAWTDPVSLPTGHQFKAGWSDTVDILRREVDQLQAGWDDVPIVLQVDADERAMRRDGGIRADAKVRSRGVVVSFDSKHGPLRYACDTFESQWYGQMPSWQANVRAVALGLEALRKVSRYGIAGRGEQYSGWNQIGTGRPMGPATMTVDQARDVLARFEIYPGEYTQLMRWDRAAVTTLYKRAAKLAHPDVGGDPEEFKRVIAARDILHAAWS